MSARTISTISERFYNQSHSWNYERTVKIGSRKVRVQIRRNAYDQQSYARTHVWAGDAWNLVCSRPISECKCSTVSYVNDGATDRLFKKDADSIIEETVEVLA